jgi:hypothetical protein
MLVPRLRLENDIIDVRAAAIVKVKYMLVDIAFFEPDVFQGPQVRATPYQGLGQEDGIDAAGGRPRQDVDHEFDRRSVAGKLIGQFTIQFAGGVFYYSYSNTSSSNVPICRCAMVTSIVLCIPDLRPQLGFILYMSHEF